MKILYINAFENSIFFYFFFTIDINLRTSFLLYENVIFYYCSVFRLINLPINSD